MVLIRWPLVWARCPGAHIVTGKPEGAQDLGRGPLTAWIDIELAASAETKFDRQRVGRQIYAVAGWSGAPGTRMLLRPRGEGRPDVRLRDVLAPRQAARRRRRRRFGRRTGRPRTRCGASHRDSNIGYTTIIAGTTTTMAINFVLPESSISATANTRQTTIAPPKTHFSWRFVRIRVTAPRTWDRTLRVGVRCVAGLLKHPGRSAQRRGEHHDVFRRYLTRQWR